MTLDVQITAEINKILSTSIIDNEMKKMIISNWEESGTGVSAPLERYKWAKLTYVSGQLFNESKEAVLPGAIAMELFAFAADIFDDIQDQDNHLISWRKIPLSQAIALAHSLLFISYDTLLSVENYEISKILMQLFNQTGLKASAGQYEEFTEQTKSYSSVDKYLAVVSKKSGSFTECACKIGGVLAGAPPGAINELGKLGENLGIIAQISNDLRDILDFHNKSDFKNKKQTLPYLYLTYVLIGERAKELNQLIKMAGSGQGVFTEKEQQRLTNIIREEGAIHYCLVFQEMFRQKALSILEKIQAKDERKRKLKKLINVISGQDEGGG
ncbi:polyprenyl synthetase family protein [Candidatus Contubernalis alkaliaceticus]|uniref:polyprenyl synthetase family protein n=1 Tax=Candidatus Contubernalis alkaliaceticus TaxID=338645 RepID=UPI001F4C360E|nr:polyprenyl synthetase family protein [Candidatus Contubernalis alkalaceticus]UNC92818.1 polyprenyl synthetase family protein [Candidatus Contubernalis alkalaceticus]